MAFLDLDKLENLQELKNLPERMEKLDNLQHLDQLQNMQKLDELQRLDQLQNMQKLDQLEHMDQLQNLDKLQDLQHMDQFQHLDQLSKLRDLHQLQNMQNLQQIQHLDRLSLLGQMKDLEKLNQLRDMRHMDSLSNLKSLDKLQVLDRLAIFDKLLKISSLLYLLSFIVPGLIFQEVISLLLGGVTLKRSLVLMTLYNVLNLFVCMMFVYPHLAAKEPYPFQYYGIWFAILILAPALLGGLIAWLTPFFNRLFNQAVTIPTKIMNNQWGQLLAGAQNYQIIITMNNEEKIRGIVSKAMPSPSAMDPRGLYLTETSHYSPDMKNWEELERPVGVWVKGTEIKMMEVSPEA